MKHMLIRLFVLIALLGVVPGLSGCRGTRDSYDNVAKKADKELKTAKEYLSNQQYFNAVAKFDEILTEIDPANNEARFGKVLGELLQFTSIIRLVSQFTGIGEEGDENDFIISLVRDFVGDMIERFENIEFELLILKSDPYARIVLPDTPVYLTASNDPTLNLQGEWDRSELFLLDVPVQAMLGILKIVDSIDLDADFLGVYNRFVDLDIDFGGAPEADFDKDTNNETLEETVYNAIEGIEKPFDSIQNLLAWVMIKNERLLALRPEVGTTRMNEAGEHLANTVDSLQKFLFFTSYDAQFDLDQTDDVVAWGASSAKYSSWDVPAAIDPDDDLCLIRDANDKDQLLLHEYTVTLKLLGPDDTLTTSPATGCLIEKLKKSLGNDGTRISLMNDIIPVVVSIIGGLDGVDFSPALLESAIVSIAEDFVGDSMEFDFGPMFAAPRGFRTFLPVWDDPTVVTDEDQWLLMMESECQWDTDADRYGASQTRYTGNANYSSRRVINRIFCKDKPSLQRVLRVPASYGCQESGEKKNLCDSTHFPVANTDAPSSLKTAPILAAKLAADGVSGVIPYVYWQDASFNGFLWLDLNGLAVVDQNDLLAAVDPEPGFQRASNASLNALLARISNKLDDIIDLLSNL